MIKKKKRSIHYMCAYYMQFYTNKYKLTNCNQHFMILIMKCVQES